MEIDMHSEIEYNKCIISMQKQYTIRNIPESLDIYLRQMAKKSGRSLNETAVQSLLKGCGLSDEEIIYNDLDHLIGTWQEDIGFDEAIRMQDQIDKEAWS